MSVLPNYIFALARPNKSFKWDSFMLRRSLVAELHESFITKLKAYSNAVSDYIFRLSEPKKI